MGRERRKVLIIGEERSARDARIMLGSMGCECALASNVEQALAMIQQKDFDAVIFDPQGSSLPAAQVISRINGIRPRLLGRVVVITDGEGDSEIRELVEGWSLPHLQRENLLQQLWATLEALFRSEAAVRRVTDVARLIFDSFRQPLPAGVRASQAPGRRLLYEFEGLLVDLWIEPQPDPNRIALVGQLLDSVKPDRKFDGVPVVLQGSKGSVGHAATNEFGEFHLDFDFESSLRLEIATSGMRWVSVALANLARTRGVSG
jgi:hypothetical protein